MSNETVETYDIVVVDDDNAVLETIRRALGKTYRVAIFSDGDKALDCLKDSGARLLATDLRMPGLNGFMLITEAKRCCPALKVLLVSGYIDPDSSDDCNIIGQYADGWLSKPFTYDELVAAVQGLIEA